MYNDFIYNAKTTKYFPQLNHINYNSGFIVAGTKWNAYITTSPWKYQDLNVTAITYSNVERSNVSRKTTKISWSKYNQDNSQKFVSKAYILYISRQCKSVELFVKLLENKTLSYGQPNMLQNNKHLWKLAFRDGHIYSMFHHSLLEITQMQANTVHITTDENVNCYISKPKKINDNINNIKPYNVIQSTKQCLHQLQL